MWEGYNTKSAPKKRVLGAPNVPLAMLTDAVLMCEKKLLLGYYVQLARATQRTLYALCLQKFTFPIHHCMIWLNWMESQSLRWPKNLATSPRFKGPLAFSAYPCHSQADRTVGGGGHCICGGQEGGSWCSASAHSGESSIMDRSATRKNEAKF